MQGSKLQQRLVPALLVKDMDETLAWYRRLGFELTGSDSEEKPVAWAEVARDGVTLQFHSEPPGGTPSKPVCSGTFYFYPDSVDVLADEFRGKVRFEWGPETMDYGMREFGLKDPSGYLLAFTEPS